MWKGFSLTSLSKISCFAIQRTELNPSYLHKLLNRSVTSTKSQRIVREHALPKHHRIYLTGVPKVFLSNSITITKFLMKLSLEKDCRAFAAKGGLTLTFNDKAKYDSAKKTLEEFVMNHNNNISNAEPDPSIPKIKRMAVTTLEEKQLFAKKEKSPSRNILDHVTPLHNLPYEEQLARKKKKVEHVLTYICRHAGIPAIGLEKVIPSPEIFKYRNSASYTIAHGQDNRSIIGFCLPRSNGHHEAVVDPTPCMHIGESVQAIRDVFQEYVESSKLPPWNKIEQSGFFRLLDVKYFSTGQGFAILTVNPKAVEPSEYKEQLSNLAVFIKRKTETKGIKLTALGIREYSGVSTPDADTPVNLLWGEPEVYEKLLNFKFRVSLGSFFQPNTSAAEKLFSLLRSWAPRPEKPTALLDVCCGTGTIGIMLSDLYSAVVGIEYVAEAVADAQFNAALNKRTNMIYHTGKVERVAGQLTANMPDTDFVAVLDPPRAGVSPSVITELRKNDRIKYVLYVSCDAANGLYHNGRKLVASSGPVPGTFVPIKAAVVDMFPQTEQCETVVLFKRK